MKGRREMFRKRWRSFVRTALRFSWPIGISLLLVSNCSKERQAPQEVVIRFPYLWIGDPGFGGYIDNKEIEEPSAIVFHPIRKTLFVVSDEGFVVELKTDGTLLSTDSLPGDLEGITVDPESGLLYILVEAVDHILEYDPDRKVVIREFPINRSYGGNPEFLEKQVNDFDNGCESITFVPDSDHPEGGTFFVGNQWDPSAVFEVEVPLKSAGPEGGEATIIRVLPIELDDPAAMYYDFDTGLLNVVSDADNILVELSLEGELVRQYAFVGDEQEGLAKDDEGFLYIAQDLGGILKIKDLRGQ
jgi:hypothetical protein